jgi:hypothetical protein
VKQRLDQKQESQKSPSVIVLWCDPGTVICTISTYMCTCLSDPRPCYWNMN